MSEEVQPIIGYRRYLLQAEFADKYVFRPDHGDQSQFNPKRNAFFDIREKLHEIHGPLVRFSLISQMGEGTQNQHIDFTKLPAGAKPIYYIKRRRDTTVSPDGETVISDIVQDECYGFGYEYVDDEGKLVKQVIEVV